MIWLTHDEHEEDNSTCLVQVDTTFTLITSTVLGLIDGGFNG